MGNSIRLFKRVQDTLVFTTTTTKTTTDHEKSNSGITKQNVKMERRVMIHPQIHFPQFATKYLDTSCSQFVALEEEQQYV